MLAGYARYLKGINDNGEAFEPLGRSAAGGAAAHRGWPGGQRRAGLTAAWKKLYSRTDVFGVDLYAVGLGEKIESMVKELYAGPGAVRKTLHKYVVAR